MFTLLLENALAVCALGAVAAVIAVCYCRSKAPNRLGLVLVVIAIDTLLLLAVERFVVTDREEIQATVKQMARDVERNDLPAVLAHIHSSVPELHSQAQTVMPAYLFERVEILRLNGIRLEGEGAARIAIAEFNAAVTGRERDGAVEKGRLPRFVVMKLKPENNRWRIIEINHLDPQEGLRLVSRGG
jgi:hypothetical protein